MGLQVCAAGVLKLGDLGLGRKMGPQTVDVASKVSCRWMLQMCFDGVIVAVHVFSCAVCSQPLCTVVVQHVG